MAIPEPDQPPTPSRVSAEDIFADPEAALAELCDLTERFERGELVMYSHEEVCRRLGIEPGPPFTVE